MLIVNGWIGIEYNEWGKDWVYSFISYSMFQFFLVDFFPFKNENYLTKQQIALALLKQFKF